MREFPSNKKDSDSNPGQKGQKVDFGRRFQMLADLGNGVLPETDEEIDKKIQELLKKIKAKPDILVLENYGVGSNDGKLAIFINDDKYEGPIARVLDLIQDNKKYAKLQEKLEKIKAYREEIKFVLHTYALSENFLSRVKSGRIKLPLDAKNKDEFDTFELGSRRGRDRADWLEGEQKNQYAVIATYTDLLHPSAIKSVNDIFKNHTLSKQGEELQKEYKKLRAKYLTKD